MIQDIYFEIKKSFGRKKHLVLISGFLFLCVMIEIVFFKTRETMLHDVERMLRQNLMMSLLVPNPLKLADGLMFARVVSYPLFWVVMPIFSFTIAGELFAGEVHDGTIKAYLSRGFSRVKLVFAKFSMLLLTNLFYAVVFSLAAWLIGMVMFGHSDLQVTLFQAGEISEPELIECDVMLWYYFRASVYYALAITAVSMFPFLLSSMMNKALAASAGGMLFYFISLIMAHLPFAMDTDVIAPFLETRMMETYIQFYSEFIEWSKVGESAAMMLLYMAFGVMVPIIAMHVKEY